MSLSFLCTHFVKRDLNALRMPRDDSGEFELLAGALSVETGFILVAEVDDVGDSGSTSMSGVADWQLH